MSNTILQWVEDRRSPAENELAERDLRPMVIARKVSFASQLNAGANTRGILISVLHTLKKQQVEVLSHRKGVLDQRDQDLRQDRFALFFSFLAVPPEIEGLQDQPFSN